MSSDLNIWKLSAGYGRHKILEELTLPVYKTGDTVGILGPNAAGKSTLVKALSGFVNASGRVQLDMTSLLECDPRERFEHIGYLPQTLPSASRLLAWELLISSTKSMRKPVSEDTIHKLIASLGLSDIAFKPVNELSGGMRQILGLVQVFLRSPRLMLLDEPTSALDLHWQVRMLKEVQTYVKQQDATAMIVLHDINLAARYCTDLVFMKEGRIVASGKTKDVLNAETIKTVYGIEARIEICSQGKTFVIVDDTHN